MAYGAWSSWNETVNGSAAEGYNSGYNHCQTRYRVDTDTPGKAYVQYQVQAMRTGTAWVGGSCYYSSDCFASWDSGSISPGSIQHAITMYDSYIGTGWKDVGTYTFTVTKDAGGTANFRYYTNCKWGMVDCDRSFSLTIKPATRTFKATASNATFDLKRNTTSVGSDISSYDATWSYNDTWTISDIKAKSGYYLTSTTSETSGTLTSNKDITVATTLKYINVSVSSTGCTFDFTYDGTKVADDKDSYTSSTIKQSKSYSVSDLKLKSGYNMWDYKNAASGTTSSSNITIVAGKASKVSLASSITYKSPLKVTSKCTNTLTDNSGRTRKWKYVAKLKNGSTTIQTITKENAGLSCEVTFDRYSTSKRLLVDTTYTVEWTVSDTTDSYNQTYTKTSTFSLPCMGYVVNAAGKKKISYFTITDPSNLGGGSKFSFKRVTKT